MRTCTDLVTHKSVVQQKSGRLLISLRLRKHKFPCTSHLYNF